MYSTLIKRSVGIRFSRRFAIIYGLIAAGTLLWCIAFIASPQLIEMGGIRSLMAIGLRYFFSFICHQNPDRSFHILGHSMAVCARCTGIYFGALIGVFSFPFFVGWFNEHSPWKKWLVIVIGLNLIEFTLSSLNLFTNLILRAGTGLTLGLWIANCALFAIFTHIQIRLKWRNST